MMVWVIYSWNLATLLEIVNPVSYNAFAFMSEIAIEGT